MKRVLLALAALSLLVFGHAPKAHAQLFSSDNAGHVICDSGCSGSGGTASNFGSSFPAAGTASGFKDSTGLLMAPGNLDASGFLKVNCSSGCAGGSASNATSGQATSSTNGQTNAWLYGFNGTGWDQLQVDGSKFLKIIAQTGSTTAATQATGTNFHAVVNPDTAANWGIGATGAAVPANSIYEGGNAVSSEPAKATTGNLTGQMLDLAGKSVTSPYANRENQLSGSITGTDTAAHTIIAAQGASVKTYITDLECSRSDAGTAAIVLTFSDAAATVLVVPNNGGGGGHDAHFLVPIVTAANTAFTFTSGTGTTTVYCSAQGYKGY